MGEENSDFPLPPPPPREGKWNLKVIALAVVCVILAASLISIVAVYQPTSLQARINDKNKEIASLQAQISSLTTQLSGNVSSIASYQSQIQALNAQLTNLTTHLNTANSQFAVSNNIVTLNATQTLVPSTVKIVNNSTDLFNSAVNYAGYLVVQATSNSTEAYARVVYSAYGVSYNQTITVGKSGTAVFPVLPATVDVKIGVPNATLNATVTVTYHY